MPSYLTGCWSRYISGQVQWADGRCYDYEATKASCDDMYVLKTKNGEETVEVAEDQNVEDLVILSCKSAETRSVI